MSHYDNERESDIDKHEIKDVDLSGMSDKEWFDGIRDYLKKALRMSDKQVKAEFDKRFPELLVRDLF